MMSGIGRGLYSGEMEDHVSVLKDEILDFLKPDAGQIIVDATFGAGGHTRSILESGNCNVIATDRDPYTEVYAEKIREKYPNRFKYLNSNFSNLSEAVSDLGVRNVDAFVFDLGVSSMQLDTPRRGFSFQNDGPLDMRMGEDSGQSAEYLVNNAEEEDLAGIIFKYGGERMSRRIAAAIVRARSHETIKRTSQLAEIIRGAVGRGSGKIDPSTKTFQAIRIWVNDELNELSLGLKAAENLLSEGGKLAVISFHSGEDKIVKEFLKERSGVDSRFTYSRYQPQQIEAPASDPTFKLETKKAIQPTEEEIKNNPRSRSAKLRLATRTGAQDWKGGMA